MFLLINNTWVHFKRYFFFSVFDMSNVEKSLYLHKNELEAELAEKNFLTKITFPENTFSNHT